MFDTLNFQVNKVYILILVLIVLNGCGGSDDEVTMDCGSSNLQASVSNVMEASCSQGNGSFELTISGGTAPFTLTLPGSGAQTVQSGSNIIENVPAGNYTLTIRDDNNCMVTTNVNVSGMNNITIEAQIEVSGCQTSNGTIMVSASGGAEPYMYSLDGGASQSGNMFSGLEVGDYTALVTDDEGCQNSVTVTVLSGISYNNSIMPIITENCAISSCHDGSNGAAPNWTDLATVQNNAQNIKTMTSNRTMPPAGQPDLEEQEIQAIACWVDDGAPAN